MLDRGRVELTCGGRWEDGGGDGRGGGGIGRSSAGVPAASFCCGPATNPARSSCGAAADVAPAEAVQAGTALAFDCCGDGPPAIWSAALPARPMPATDLSARRSGSGVPSADPTDDPSAEAVAQGGSAAGSLGVFCWDGTPAGVDRTEPSSSSVGGRPGEAPRAEAAKAVDAAAPRGAPPDGSVAAPGDPAADSRPLFRQPRPAWSPTGPSRPHEPLRDAPIPGTRGTRERRLRGSTPPGARRREVPAEIWRNSGVGGPGSWSGHLARPRTPRRGRPGHPPNWAGLARSSSPMIPALPRTGSGVADG